MARAASGAVLMRARFGGSPVAAFPHRLACHRYLKRGIDAPYEPDETASHDASIWSGDRLEKNRSPNLVLPEFSRDQASSKRSRSMTLPQAAAKSRTNVSFESSHA